MLRRKGGCDEWGVEKGVEYCPDEKRKDDVPSVQWFVGVAFGFVEMYGFSFPVLWLGLGMRANDVVV